MPNSFAAVRILVVDDFEPFRRVLHAILKTRPELQVIGEASDGLEAIQKAEDLQPDLILLDIGLPKLNGIETADRLCRLVPDAKILFVSQDNDPDLVATALSSGGNGYLWKQTANTQLLPAIEAVLRQDDVVSVQVDFHS
jgi:DNA-binding NarL/FixJ family response regulator